MVLVTIFLRRRIVGQPGVQKSGLTHGKNPSYDALTSAILTTYLDKGTYSKAELLGLAMEAAPLQEQINLVGFQSAGLAYDPFTFL